MDKCEVDNEKIFFGGWEVVQEIALCGERILQSEPSRVNESNVGGEANTQQVKFLQRTNVLLISYCSSV